MLESTRIIGLLSKSFDNNESSVVFYLTADQKIGFGLKTSNVDAEKNIGSNRAGISRLVRDEDNSLTIRFISNYGYTQSLSLQGTARDGALKEIGRNAFTNYVFFERSLGFSSNIKSLFGKTSFDERIVSELHSSVNYQWFTDNEMLINPCDVGDYKYFSIDPMDTIEVGNTSFRYNSLYGAIARLWEPLGTRVSNDLLPNIRHKMGVNHYISTTIKKKNKARVLLGLMKRQKQTERATNRVDATKNEGIQAAQEDLEIHNAEIFDVDMNVVFYGQDKEEVETRAHEGKSYLKELGFWGLETGTSFRAFSGTRIGSTPNYAFVEEENDIDPYIPIYAYGPSKTYSQTSRSLGLHRLSGDVEFFDLYKEADAKSNFSAVVIGKMGRGKSVFLNSMVDCMLMDKKLSVFLVDVKGSYKRTISRYRNKVYSLELGKATGLNPFRLVKQDFDVNKKVELLKEFIKTLIRKPDEKYIDPEIVSLIEQSLKAYIESQPSSPGISDFVNKHQEVPRIETLKRWCSGGAFEMVFRGYEEGDANPQVTYFNFEDISTASDPEVSKAVMSAIMCEYYSKLNSKPIDEKLVFIADETPFFVKESFDFFKLTNKNIRKLNGSMILAAQSSSDLVVNGDRSLIDNVDTYMLFSVDGQKNTYQELFKLSDSDYDRVVSCELESGDFSSFMLKDSLGFRQCYLRLTPEEYWKSTSRAQDTHKLNTLMSMEPGFSETDCYQILKRGGMS